jgi:hypothetical protein
MADDDFSVPLSPVRVQSLDTSLAVEVSIFGIFLRIEDHEFYFIVRKHNLSASGGFTAPKSFHDADARTPEDCSECQWFILRK